MHLKLIFRDQITTIEFKMKNIIYAEENKLRIDELLHLYNDAGWTAYTNQAEKLPLAIQQSLCVFTARCNNELVGLIRAVGDGLTIVFIQDILVLKAFQRKKIGTALMQLLLKKYSSVRQKSLLTDNTIKNRKFYESFSFTACEKVNTVAFYRDELEQK